MTDTFRQQLKAVRITFEEAKVETLGSRKALFEQIRKLTEHLSKYENGWVGDWTENTNLYYKNFDPNSFDKMRIDESYVKNDLTKRTGIKIDEIRNKITPISQRYFKLRDFILSELSFIKDLEAFKNEAELLKQIEDFQWGMRPGEYVRSRRPSHAFVYDLSVFNRGLPTPPHISLGEDILHPFSLLASYDNFDTIVHRLIRQLEIKSTTSSDIEDGAVFQQQALNAIIERFHLVATQLSNRYDSRPALNIGDEYDVQDLMNALLRINFEDVRKEEYTPSYAGGSTRIDFLLKREKILIEVKKTRQSLKDKDIGNQLILDIAHYKSHPDCKHLICFVYDPENLVNNPRGLEDDLNKNTTEEMIVEVYIRP